MSYHIYTTKALILSTRAYREADSVYLLLTRDLGLVRATATGVRKESSKLRGSLEPISLGLVSLVRGQDYWRITAAQNSVKVPPQPEILRPLSLLEKLIQGEAHHPELFDTVEKYLLNYDEGEEDFETKLVAESLFHLGYLKVSDLELPKKELTQAINEGLRQSHLA